jgi:predicted nucleotidyltransferase
MDDLDGAVTVLLSGVIGSTAYGLAGPDSDIDMLGLYAAPARAFHGLMLPIDRRASIVRHQPDVTLHEARKYVLLYLQANPTIIDLLWLPNELYQVRTAAGTDLIALRTQLLAADRVRDAYLGYAGQQLRRLENKATRHPEKVAKHARHLLRLVHQGIELYTTGQLTVRLADPQRYHDFGHRAAADPAAARVALAEAEAGLATARSALPERADVDAADAWLHRVRDNYR